MLRSFKLKMALFSLSTSGAILLAFATLFIAGVRRAGLERVDRHLHAVVESQLRRPLFAEQWARFDDSLNAIYGDGTQHRFLLNVIGPNGQAIYMSPRWPATLDCSMLLPDLSDAPREPRDDAPQPPRQTFQPKDREPPPHTRPKEHFAAPPFSRPGEESPQRLRPRPPHFVTARIQGQTWRFLATRTPNATFILGTDMAEVQAELRHFLIAYAIAVPLGLLLLASGGWLLAKRALKPVQHLTQVASALTAKGLDQRVQTVGADQEFQSLIDVINGMLNRLEVSFRQAARFSADAAHELKTPLTILQGQLNQALRSAPAGSDEQRTYADLLEEVQRLKGIVRKLLLLAQSDSGQLRLSLKKVCLNWELQALFEDLPLLAPELTLTQDLAPDVQVKADPDLLRQVLQNLISNAVKYNHAHGELSCQLRSEAGWAHLSVANTTAPGMTIDRDRLFDRFYRGDAAHSRKIDGTGLGLSLAREISRAHGGDLVVEEARDGWISFRLSLVIEPPGAAAEPAPASDAPTQLA